MRLDLALRGGFFCIFGHPQQAKRVLVRLIPKRMLHWQWHSVVPKDPTSIYLRWWPVSVNRPLVVLDHQMGSLVALFLTLNLVGASATAQSLFVPLSRVCVRSGQDEDSLSRDFMCNRSESPRSGSKGFREEQLLYRNDMHRIFLSYDGWT